MSQAALDQFQSAPDAAGALARWADHLRIERQVSPHTLNAYLRDITQFTGFLKGHLGAAPGLRDLETLKPMDFRAFMAARAMPVPKAARWPASSRPSARCTAGSTSTAFCVTRQLPRCARQSCRMPSPSLCPLPQPARS
jgi:hypothetical protein